MNIIRSEAHATERGRSDYFAGTVWLEPIAVPAAPARLRAFRVTFEPGARTAWHTHPLGQVLHILSGVGRVQRAGGPVETVNPGDTVLFAPNEKHWHGAAPDHIMAHLAMQEADSLGIHVTWLEHVSDADHGAA